MLGKGNDQRIMVMNPLSGEAGAVTLDKFIPQWSGECLRVSEPFSLSKGQRRFGLSWFLPVLLKYKSYLFEVILASF